MSSDVPSLGDHWLNIRSIEIVRAVGRTDGSESDPGMFEWPDVAVPKVRAVDENIEEARSTEDDGPILGAHFETGSDAERELSRGGGGWVNGSRVVRLARIIVHDALEPLLLTDLDAVELESEHRCTMVLSLDLEKEVTKPLERQIVASRKYVVRDKEGDFVLDGIRKLEVLPDVAVEQIGCSLARGPGLGLAKYGCGCALEGLFGEARGRESAV